MRSINLYGCAVLTDAALTALAEDCPVRSMCLCLCIIALEYEFAAC